MISSLLGLVAAIEAFIGVVFESEAYGLAAITYALLGLLCDEGRKK